MKKDELIKKITQKKDFSDLPKKDVEKVFEKFDKDIYLDEEKIKLTRDLLRKIYSAFVSPKILSPKDKDYKWILRKHISTKERLGNYEKLYSRVLGKFNGVVFDLGAGVNGFSYNYFPKKIKYVGVEAVGQLVHLMNFYFKKNKMRAKAIHESLFDLEKIKKIIESESEERVVFLFKTIDSLEMVEKDFSFKFLKEIAPLANRIVVSFAQASLVKKTKFKVNRNWILKFIEGHFDVLDDFELGNERYVVFERKKSSALK